MKKSVVLTIGVIYVFAVVIVGLIGIKLKVYDEIEYTENITCVSNGYELFDPNNSDDLEYINKGITGYIMKRYSTNLTVEIRCELTPNSISKDVLQYTIDSKAATGKRNEDGTYTVTFNSKGTANVYAFANDGSNKKIGILIVTF